MTTEDRISHLEAIVATLLVEKAESQKLLATVFHNQQQERMLQSSSPFDTGDTAWLLTSSALVLFMTIPGLALFYGGMARTKNVLAIVMQCFVITALITVEWLAFGYSLAFAPVHSSDSKYSVYGDASRFWLQGMDLDSYHDLSPTVPESVFCVFQLTFAIITPALITGSFADRMKFGSMLIFMFLWHLIVYCPIAHANWHPSGFLYVRGALDFAGGNAVETASGVSGLACAIFLGVRRGYGKESFEPHNILLTVVGAGIIWMGWFGFNGGSAMGANARAGFAVLTTQIAGATSALSWMVVEWVVRKQPSVLGTVSGAVAGLVAITPGCGYVDQTGAFIIGLIAGPVCYAGVQMKHHLGYDDALDAFGVHALGGIFGLIATGFFATDTITANSSSNGVFYGNTDVGGNQLANQLYALTVSIFWSLTGTLAILYALEYTIGLRVSAEEEEAGLDSSLHGESIIPVLEMTMNKEDMMIGNNNASFAAVSTTAFEEGKHKDDNSNNNNTSIVA